MPAYAGMTALGATFRNFTIIAHLGYLRMKYHIDSIQLYGIDHG